MALAIRSSLIRSLLIGASLVVIIAGMRAASPFLSPMLLALFLAVLLNPLYQGLLRRGIPTWLAVSIMVVGVMLVGLGLLALLWVSAERLRANLFFYATQLTGRRVVLEAWLEEFGIDAPSLVSQEIFSRQFLINGAGRLLTLLTNLGQLLFNGFFVLVITIFLLLQGTQLSGRLERELGPNSTLQTQVVDVGQRVARFFAIRVRVNLIVAVGITIWLLILGVDLAILWGVLAFFLSFIMYVGLAMAAAPPVLLALAESGLIYAVLVIVGVAVINIFVENVMAPAMMGQGLNLAPAVALGSLVFWAWVLGPLGFVLAIPLTVIVVMIIASNPETHWLVAFLTMDPPQMDRGRAPASAAEALTEVVPSQVTDAAPPEAREQVL